MPPRPRTVRPARVAAPALAVALLLAACSGAGERGPGTTPGAGGDGPSSTAAPPATGDGELVIGTLLPQTGGLSPAGPAGFVAVHLAVQDVNAAGGVNGRPVRQVDSDSGGPGTGTAADSVDRLLADGVDVVVGPLSPQVSLEVQETLTGAGVLQVGPGAVPPPGTDPALTVRTGPSDADLGGAVAAVVDEDGRRDVLVVAPEGPAGEGLAGAVVAAVADRGAAVQVLRYDPDDPTAAGPVPGAGLDAVVLVGDGPDEAVAALGVAAPDAVTAARYLAGAVPAADGTRPPAGTTVVLPAPPGQDALAGRLRDLDPGLPDLRYAAEVYDAVVLVALAAVAAGDDSGTSVASRLAAVSRGGTPCDGFAACADLLAAGEDVDYQGLSGPLDLTDAAAPERVPMAVHRHHADGTVTVTAR